MKKIKAAYLSLVKGSWITDLLEKRRKTSLKALETLDNVEIIDCGQLVQNEAEAEKICRKFEDEKVDVIIAHYITFSLGGIVPGMAAKLRKPVLFWSEPEPAMKGKRIEANSFCATNMNAHALWKMNLKYDFIYGNAASAVPEIQRRINVIACVNHLRNVRIGSAGGRVPGFYTSNFSELEMREKFGVEAEGVTLLEIVKRTETASKKSLVKAREVLMNGCVCGNVSEEELNKGTALLASFMELTEKYHLDAWTVRCWPEFSDLYGIGVCHLLGCLTGLNIPAACEGDMYGALAMLISESLTGKPSFFCDLISFDPDGDTGLFWHCGAAPVALCRKGCKPTINKHSIIDGGDKKGLACEFPLEAGPVTVLRISESRDRKVFRLMTISGDGIETEQLLKGNPLKVKFRRSASEITETLIENGFEHHYVMARGDIAKDLKFFAKLLELELTQL
ncbi:MAG: hypothetical protein UT30_C0004G0026 [Candidatus Uhrbacteria bacterium GW2011_GWF2_39_13]|uniref:L-fucose isomerase C-terminal domain-containing protein n=1 Tax=Candidatus Uhrbacteria bacterium GW2011_GWF2_39_13 TaxID=1618995 RepID=A0A0G0MNN8_9BACT|nr:MAG: hypothetical protein UT30_C0004G0026 [Candidatus Uhrbacteria bacterium GW2011_GWF2_39_13]